MKLYSYKLDHDYGLAPNPFGQFCTLAVCKPTIRSNKKLNIGDWVIGTGSKKLKKNHHLIFAMEVSERITFQEYWDDERFQYKKPLLNGSLVQMYGDNFYHKTLKGDWIQEASAHSIVDNEQHLKNDTSGKFVLISENFFYFGNNSPKIPNELLEVCNEGRNMKSESISDEITKEFLKWLKKNKKPGLNGDPINWKEHLKEHNQTILKI
ncbi:MAG: hypothetical protein ACSHW7_06470 [Patiriisocius sp.]|uniref:Nmad2 family putative nucleotide modification protein n=1 Tax=Patiriisocius sp. TaxID=2822396 RepID=UPI003EF39256